MLRARPENINKYLILLGFILTALFSYSHFIDGDVIQILDKAHVLVTQHRLIPYGNASTSGASGNIPGAFLTLATGGPMLLWFSPWSALALLALLHFLAYLMFRNVLKNFVNPWSMTALVVLFWLNPWRLSEVFLWNPGYIYVASLLHMWSAWHLAKKANFKFSVIHGLSLFLGLQIHPSFVILFFMTLMLLWTKALKPHLLGTLTGIILGLLSLTPYFLEGMKDPSIFPQPGSGDGKGHLFFGLIYVYPMLKGFWYWILFGSNIFQTHVFHQIDFSWVGNMNAEKVLKVVWTGIKYLIGAFGVGLSFYANFHFYKKNKDKFKIFSYKMKNEKDWLSLYAVVAFLAAMMATAIAPTLPIYWHLLYVWPMALIPILLKLNEYFSDKMKRPSWLKYILIVGLYFTATNLIAAVGSKKHDINKPFSSLYFKACKNRCSMDNLKSSDEFLKPDSAVGDQ